MALNIQIWRKYILEQLFKDNEFLKHSFRVGEDYIVNGSIVHMPNAGANPAVQRNRTLLPAEVTRREDVDVIYKLDEFTTDPVHISDIEKVELSYNKIASVIGSHINTLSDTVADWMIYKWLTKNTTAAIDTAVVWGAGTFVSTSGAAGSGNGPNSQNLKKFALADLASARLVMNRLNVPKNDRYCLLPSVMYDEMLQALGVTNNANQDLQRAADLPAGVLFRLFGFNIMERSSVALFTKSTPTVQAPGTTETSSHGYGAICWQKDKVETAVGNVKMFQNINDPTYYGDIYSALVRCGGRARYDAATGVVPIIQTA